MFAKVSVKKNVDYFKKMEPGSGVFKENDDKNQRSYFSISEEK